MTKLLVIGAGPAGLIAAGRASARGVAVVVLDKNRHPGVKLLATGGGRCNLTNLLPVKELAAAFGPQGRFLLSALTRFGPDDVIDFFAAHGVVCKVEGVSQVFPASNRANDVLAALLDYCAKGKVEFRQAEVKALRQRDGRITQAVLADGSLVEADEFVVATGGRSYPATGSTGDGYRWLANLGHTIVPTRPGLVPLEIRETFIKELEGLSMKQIALTVYQERKKIIQEIGDVVFTSRGLSGPAAHNDSRWLTSEQLAGGALELELDLWPQLSEIELDKKLESLLAANGKKLCRNCLAGLLPPKLQPVILRLARITAATAASQLRKESRLALAALLKHFKLTLSGMGGFERAIVTAGGVALSEIDPKTMRSRLLPNLYVVGEVLDLAGPSGGYNLQSCWSTGYAAGEAAGRK